MAIIQASPDRLRVLLADLSDVKSQLKMIDESLTRLTDDSAKLMNDPLMAMVIFKLNEHNKEEQIRLDLIDKLIARIDDVVCIYEKTEEQMADCIKGIDTTKDIIE